MLQNKLKKKKQKKSQFYFDYFEKGQSDTQTIRAIECMWMCVGTTISR